MPVAFEGLARPLLFVHLVAAAVSLGSAVHLAVAVWRRRRRGIRIHGTLTGIAYGVCFALGCLIYPTFRVRVRHEHFDFQLPWATGLFEAKEHLASVGLVAALGLLILARSSTDDDKQGAPARPLFVGLLVLLLLVLSLNALDGWYLTSLRSI